MAEIISSVSAVFTAAIGWVSTVADTVTGEPILLLYATIGLVGLGVGLFSRLISVNR